VRYLLDTNTCIEYLNDAHSAVAKRLRSEAPTDVALCSVVKGELLYGAFHSDRPEANPALLAEFFDGFVPFPFDDAAADNYGRVRSALAKQGIPIGPNDLLIAAIALANGLTLVTHNTREFDRVAGLSLEDWRAG